MLQTVDEIRDPEQSVWAVDSLIKVGSQLVSAGCLGTHCISNQRQVQARGTVRFAAA
jgi:hypothetical protein